MRYVAQMARRRGRGNRCRVCEATVTREINGQHVGLCDDCLAANLSSWSSHASSKGWASRIKSKYGLTDVEHARMFAEQNGLCWICRDPKRSSRDHGTGLVIDHDHATGEVRGLLCSRCNAAIGMLDDNPHWINRASQYISQSIPHEVRVQRRWEREQRTRAHVLGEDN